MLLGPRRRVGRRGVLGVAATTAVVAGTATAVSGGMRNRQADKAQQAADAQAYEQQQQAGAMLAAAQLAVAVQTAAQLAGGPPPAPAAAGGDDLITKLNELAQLKDQGILSEEEFAAAKAKLLS